MLSNKQRNTKIISSGFLVEIIQGFYTQIFMCTDQKISRDRKVYFLFYRKSHVHVIAGGQVHWLLVFFKSMLML